MALMRIASAVILLAASLTAGENGPPPVVPDLELNRYAGTWYEIARFPNRFEKVCARDVTARYTLRPDGKIDVLNSCTKADGKRNDAKGTAKLASEGGPKSKLKVTFFWPFYGDYWVLALDPGYRWALVGSPKRDFLWILSRSPKLAAADFESITEKAKLAGFDSARLVPTRQGS